MITCMRKTCTPTTHSCGVQYCKHSARKILGLKARIHADVRAKIQHYGQVNYLWHGAKRVPVAFVPFGVAAVNFVGMSRLVTSILRDTGMLRDRGTQAACLQCAGKSYAAVCLLGNLSDLYEITAAGAVVAGAPPTIDGQSRPST